MAPVIFLILGFWYGAVIPVFWPLAAVFIGSATLGVFRGFTDSIDEGGVVTGLTELLVRYCWVPFALGAIIGACIQVLR